jgi:hypothetical protein
MFSKASILAQLDDCVGRLDFMTLEEAQIARIHVFADPDRWALAFESLTDSQNGHKQPVLYVYGNCLINATPGRVLLNEKQSATWEILGNILPGDLPKLMQLDQWYHPDIVQGQLPSQVSTFVLLSEVLWKADPDIYKPVDRANTAV